MFGYEPVQHDYYFKFPEGAIRTRQGLEIVLEKVAETGTNAVMYTVSQSGYMSTVDLTPETAIVEHKFEYVSLSRAAEKLINTDGSYVFLGDVGVGVGGVRPVHESHRSFLDKEAALRYSNWMQNDPVYKASVKHWHRHCDKIDEYIDRLFGSDDY